MHVYSCPLTLRPAQELQMDRCGCCPFAASGFPYTAAIRSAPDINTPALDAGRLLHLWMTMLQLDGGGWGVRV